MAVPISVVQLGAQKQNARLQQFMSADFEPSWPHGRGGDARGNVQHFLVQANRLDSGYLRKKPAP